MWNKPSPASQGKAMENMMITAEVQTILERITGDFIADCGSAYEVNNGCCEEWGYEVLEALADFPCMVGYWETDVDQAHSSHVFIEIDGRWYDAECLDGVDDYMQLPLFAKWQKKHPGEVEPVQLEDYNNAYQVTRPTRLGYTEEQLAAVLVRDEQFK